jgi:hypothetical protein
MACVVARSEPDQGSIPRSISANDGAQKALSLFSFNAFNGAGFDAFKRPNDKPRPNAAWLNSDGKTQPSLNRMGGKAKASGGV